LDDAQGTSSTPPVAPNVMHRAQPPTAAPTNADPGEAARGSKSIAGEIALLDTVRRSLASGQASAALAGLAEYDKKYASGVLRPEAVLLRIEALARAGNTSSARRLAARFLRDHPTTPHEARVRALVGPLP
jgi:TolA-binding protein